MFLWGNLACHSVRDCCRLIKSGVSVTRLVQGVNIGVWFPETQIIVTGKSWWVRVYRGVLSEEFPVPECYPT